MTRWRNFRDKDELEFNAWAWLVLLNTGARSVVFMYSDVKAGFKGLWRQFQAHKVVIQRVIHHWGIIFKKQHSSTVALTYWLLQGAFIHASELWGKTGLQGIEKQLGIHQNSRYHLRVNSIVGCRRMCVWGWLTGTDVPGLHRYACALSPDSNCHISGFISLHKAWKKNQTRFNDDKSICQG